MARDLDALAVIFPFEVECYADTRLPVEFVGHPFLAKDYVPPVRYDPQAPVLLLPGSRTQAVARIYPVLLAAQARYRAGGGEKEAAVIYPSDEVAAVLQRWNPPACRTVRTGTTVAASAVLTSSGTMSLHCALAGIPGAIAYRTNPLTYLLARWWVKLDYIGIANLLLKEPMYPEFIQGAATPEVLAAQLRACVGDPERRARTVTQQQRLRALLDQPAAGTVADWVSRHLRKTE
jgi:lipid-A-disaccharide synthase